MSVASSTPAGAPPPGAQRGGKAGGESREAAAGAPLHALAVAAVLGIGLLLRAALLRLPMRYDEAYSFYHYAIPGTEFARSTYDFPNNQILNSLLMHHSWQAFGTTLWSLRLPALVAGSLIPVFAYLAARRIYGPRAGLWAAALTATAGPIVEFSVNARGYTLGGLFVVICLWLAARMLDTRGLWEVPAFGVCAALAVWSVPTMGYGLAAIGLWAGANALLRVRSSVWPVLRLGVAAVLGGLLGYWLYRPTFGDPAWGFEGLAQTMGNRRATLAAAWHFWMRTTPFPLPTLLGLSFLAACVFDRRRLGIAVPLAAAILATTFVVLFIGEIPPFASVGKIPPFARSWFALLPLSAVAVSGILAAGTALAAQRLRRPAALAGRRALLAVALPVIVAVAMSADLLLTGQHGSEEFPTSDNNIVNVVRDELKLDEVLMDPAAFSIGVQWYFDRFGYKGFRERVTPEMVRKGHVDVIIPGHDGGLAFATVGKWGGRPAPPPMAPQLVRSLEYVSIWRVPLEPAPEPAAP